MNELHVALITPWERQGGVATYSDRLTEALETEGITVTPVPITKPETGNPLFFYRLASDVPPDTDVVHVQFEAGLFGRFGISGVGAPAFFLALNRVDRPVLVTLHEVHRTHPHRGAVGDLVLRARDACIERLALIVSDVVQVHTREAAQTLRDRHGDSGKIERLLHPVETDAKPIPTDEAKAALDITGDIVLTFGWVEAKKRYEEVIRLLPEFPSVTYVLAGPLRDEEGEDVLESTFELAEELGVRENVEYLGYVEQEQIPHVFSAADVVVLPYERVSQSGVVNDALAYHCPVVASDLPAFAELRDEFDCLLTYRDHGELRTAIENILEDPETRNRLVERAAAYTDTVTWKWFARETRTLYDRITNGPRGTK